MNSIDVKFFLGSNTKRGFVPLFDKLKKPETGHHFYILKGGPGSGKSTLMRRIAKTLMEHGHFVEFMPCASDPDSLDAIYDHDGQIAIVDGTAPHILDPDYPGAYDIIINMADAWSNTAIEENKQNIIELSREISGCHRMATACIKSAAALLDQNRLIAEKYLDRYKISDFAGSLIKKLDGADLGEESHRLLSAVTVGKLLFFDKTISSLCKDVYIIEDEWGAASTAILSEIRDYAIKMNLAFISCYCSINVPDKIDHILFPSIGLGISTSNSYHSADGNFRIQAQELMNPVNDYELAGMNKHSLLARELIDLAANHVAQAKNLHDRLEKYYISAMDFSKVDEIYQRLIEDILSFSIRPFST